MYKIIAIPHFHNNNIVDLQIITDESTLADKSILVGEFEDYIPIPFKSKSNGVYNYKYINGELFERTLEEKEPIESIKFEKKSQINQYYKHIILQKYPEYQQRNVAIGIQKYQHLKNEMVEFIEQQIQLSDEKCQQIDQLTDRDKIKNFKI